MYTCSTSRFSRKEETRTPREHSEWTASTIASAQQPNNILTPARHCLLSRGAAGAVPAPGEVLAPPVPLFALAVVQPAAAVRQPLRVHLFRRSKFQRKFSHKGGVIHALQIQGTRCSKSGALTGTERSPDMNLKPS